MQPYKRSFAPFCSIPGNRNRGPATPVSQHFGVSFPCLHAGFSGCALSRFQVQSEWGFLVGDHAPALAMKSCGPDGCDGYAFVGELFRLPGLAICTPGKDGVVTDEEEEIVCGDGADLNDGTERYHAEKAWVGCVDDVGIAARDGAYFVWIGSGPEAGGDGRVAESEGASGQKRLPVFTWLEKYFERAALDFFRFARIDEVPDGQDQGTRGQNFGMPAVGKGAVE